MMRRATIWAAVVTGLLLVQTAAHGQTYVVPITPPGGAIAVPINGSATAQRLNGSLTIGTASSTAKLCLNASGTCSGDSTISCTNNAACSPSAGTCLFTPTAELNDAVHCISTWSEVVNAAGPFVNLGSTDLTAGSPLNPGSYVSQAGYGRVLATSASQAISGVAHATRLCFNSRCPNNAACTKNSDCKDAGGQSLVSTAIYTSDAGNSGNMAGYFGGKLMVTFSPTVPAAPGQLCLNGTSGANCITNWDSVAALGTGGVVALQLNPPTSQQIGKAAVSGGAQAGAVVSGSCGGTNPACFCGDGLCSAGQESAASCAIDCAEPVAPTSLTPTTINTSVKVTAHTAAQQPAGSVLVLITRTDGSSSNFQPLFGTTYQPGMVIGGTTILASSTASQGVDTSYTDAAVTTGQTYLYQAFQGNLFPAYAIIHRDVSVLVWKLTVTKNSAAGGIVTFSVAGTNYTCDTTCLSISVVALDGTSITLSSAQTHSWGAPCAGGGNCTVTMNKNINLRVDFGQTNQCFAGGTLIATPDGPRPIETLAVGDRVYAHDAQTGQTVVSRVKKFFIHPDVSYGRVVFSDGTVLDVTPNHPVYDARHASWRPISTMRVGDVVLKGQGLSTRHLTIRSIEFGTARGDVYNLEVGGFHNYYANGILVHNKGSHN